MTDKNISLDIVVLRTDKTLTLTETTDSKKTILFSASIVSGCESTGTPLGKYKAGKWIKDKTNTNHGPIPWSKAPWSNPYGPYFLPLHDKKTGVYTLYGIHGTRGPVAGNFEKPPIPEALLSAFIGKDEAKYLYCSHGCVRLSNRNINRLFELTTKTKYAHVTTTVTIK